MRKYLGLLLLLTPWAAFGQTLCPGEEWVAPLVSYESTTIEFFNNLSDDIKIFRINSQKERELASEVTPGQSVVEDSFVGHPWVVTDVQGNCINLFFAEDAARVVRIAHHETCDAESLPERAFLESPSEDSHESGIGVIRGWVCCDAGTVDIVIDDGDFVLEAPQGSRRADTEAVCGDVDNGFGLTFNWNALEDGKHRVQALVNGVEFADATFNVKTLDQNFVKRDQAIYTLKHFPALGKETIIQWSNAHQNFVIIGEDD
ncbi:MAG: hypothetical protein H6970_07755 [Gammaproteobacteria bacterium]|nr:hypothetical protein [Gammaproteobacteria bacterium]MCP5458075.1 hypothetical protein [Gammaproteobacteria bacterium]